MRIICGKMTQFNTVSRPQSSSSSIVWVDGRSMPDAEATIPVFDSAYLYGMGVFETMRAEAGSAVLLRLHFERMKKNAQRVGIKFPFGQGYLMREIGRLLKTGHLSQATLRVILSERNAKPHLVIIA